MDAATRAELGRLLQVAESASQRGDYESGVVALQQRAAIWLASKGVMEAQSDLARALEMARALGAPQVISDVLLSLGMIESRIPGFSSSTAGERYEEALREAEKAADSQRTATILKRQVQHHLTRADPKSAAHVQTRCIQLLDAEGPSVALAEAYEERARLNVLQRRLQPALRDLDEAEQIAEGLRAPSVFVRVKLQRKSLLGAKAPTEPTYEQLVRAADACDDPPLLGKALFEAAADAVRRKQFALALRYTEPALELAQRIPEPTLYLNSCLLIAEAREQLGDRGGVITILVTCMSTLEEALGPEAGDSVRNVLASLEKRWGREGVSEAYEIHEARMRQKAES